MMAVGAPGVCVGSWIYGSAPQGRPGLWTGRVQVIAEEMKVDPITQGFQVGRRESSKKESEEKPSVKGREPELGTELCRNKIRKNRQLRCQGRKISRRKWPTRHMQETSRKTITKKFQVI